jgi:hypothetical protein
MYFAKYLFGPKVWELPLFLKGYRGLPYAENFHFLRNIVDGQVWPKFKVLSGKFIFKDKNVTLLNKGPKFEACVQFLVGKKVATVGQWEGLGAKDKKDFQELFVGMIQEKYQKKIGEMWGKLF